MMILEKLVGTAAVAAAASAISTTAAVAQQADVVVEKHLSPVTRYVPYADLSLSTKEGRKSLYHRVGQAVDQVCPDFDEEGRAYDTSGCIKFAWEGAYPQIGRAIKDAQSGKSAMSAAITIAAGPAR